MSKFILPLYILFGILTSTDHANRHGCFVPLSAQCTTGRCGVGMVFGGFMWPLYWTWWGAKIVTKELRS